MAFGLLEAALMNNQGLDSYVAGLQQQAQCTSNYGVDQNYWYTFMLSQQATLNPSIAPSTSVSLMTPTAPVSSSDNPVRWLKQRVWETCWRPEEK